MNDIFLCDKLNLKHSGLFTLYNFNNIMLSLTTDFLNCHDSLIRIDNGIRELIILRIATKNLCIGNIIHGYMCISLKKLQNDKRKKIKMMDIHIN